MKKLLLTTVLAVATIVAMANPIGRTAAMQKAQNFMRGINPQAALQTPATPRRAMGNQSEKPYYIFNAENNQGFVIVSGDDRSEEILGFSDKGFLDVDNLPSGLLYMLDTFEEDLQKLDEQGYTNTVDAQVSSNSRRKSLSVPREPIAPLIKTYWTQESPFVDMMTEDVVGCQRIASAQLLYYWGCDKTLATITGVPTSIQSSGKYEPQTFDMSKIRAHYRGGSGTDEERAEVARYISCVRYSLGTGTQSDMVSKGPKFWGITPGAILYRQNCFPDDFERIIYEELSNNAPVFVGGHCRTSTPNHYFLIDGYSHDDFFHINWGWAGVCDGYFRLSPLNAYNWSTAANWSQTFEALIGMRGPGLVAESTAQPNDEASLGLITYSFANSSNSIVWDDQTVSRTGTLKIRTLLENWSNNFKSDESRTFDLELVAYDMNNNKVKTIATKQITIAQAATQAVVWTLTGIDLPAGEYQLVSKSKDATYTGESHFDYVKGVYSHAKLVVDDNQITASLVKAMTIDNYEFIGKKKPGYRTAVKFYVTNNSFNKLTWNFSLYKNQISSTVGYTQDTEEFRMQAKSSHDFVMEFEADEEPCTLFLYNQDRAARSYSDPIYAEIAFDPSSFPAATATNSNLSFKWSLNNTASTGTNGSGGYVYGYSIEGTVKITNNSRNATFEDVIIFQIYYGRASYNNRYKSANIMVPLKLAPGASTTVDLSEFEYSDGAFDAEKTLYILVFDGSYRIDEDNNYFTYASWSVRPSVNYWDKDGKLSYATSVPTNISNAAAVSFKGMSVSKTIYPNSNPNCIYYFDTETQAKKLNNYQNYNVVVGDQAYTTIKFDETNAVYVPFTFTDANVTYTRKMTNAQTEGSEDQKWSTICLPFEVNSVKEGNNQVQIGDGVELRKFYGEEFASIYFDAAYKMEANKPYLIRVSEENVNKTLTFAATNATVVAGSAMLDANNYDFTGNYTTTRDEKGKYVYTIDSNGNNFVYTASPTYKTFYAYITAEAKLQNTLFINDRAPKKAVKSDHRFPAVQFTYNGVAYEVPAWDELAVNGTVRTRLQALSKIQTGQTSIPARTVSSCAQSVDDESVFEPFEGGTGNITIDNVTKSVSTLTYGEVCDQLNILIADADRDVKVFDFTPATETSITVPTVWENDGRTFIMNEIGAGTYYNNSTLTEVTIPAGITAIKDAAFAGCTALNKVTFENAEPVAVEGDPFAGVTKNMCAVYGPSNVVKTYRESNPIWNEFIFATPISATKKFVSFCSDVPFTTRQFTGKGWDTPVYFMYWINKSNNNDPSSLKLTSTRDSEKSVIPAGFGLVLKTTSEGGSGYIFMPPVGASEKANLIADNNLLKGCTVVTPMDPIIEANPDYRYYGLQDNKFKRIKLGNGNSTNAGRAYLELPESLFNGEAKSVISIEDDVTDGIILIDNGQLTMDNDDVYDIQGRKVERTSKGIYIVNGKKVVMK